MKKVLLLLANGFEILEASVFIDVIGWNLVDGDHSTELFSCALTKEVQSSFNQRFIVDYVVGEINADEWDALAIPGGFNEYGFYEDAYNEHFLKIIRDFNEKGKLIASICVGALPLGKSGVLDGRNATTYNGNPARLETLKSFGANVISEPIVVSENIITSWNPSTAVDVAFWLLEKLTSPEQRALVSMLMGFTR